MKPWSLKLRLITFAALGMSVVLGVAGMGFSWLYRQHVEKFALTELSTHMEQLLAGVTVDDKGIVSASSKLSDPRFEQPGGGLYWQIDVAGQDPLRSRSLWDEAIAVPTPPSTTEEDHAHILTLPSGDELFALEKLIVASNAAATDKNMVVTVGIDRSRVTNPISEFLSALLVGLSLTYAALLATTFAIIMLGLKPLQAVQRGIVSLRSGANHFDGNKLPYEIAPLADEINALVSAREKQLDSARKRASNLAHGLKTPLAVMLSVANELRAQGHETPAENIAVNTNQMRDLVDRELTRSRMAQGFNTHRAALNDVLARVVATMKKAPRGDALVWEIAIPANTRVAMDAVDLMELLGNLLDNARKHAVELVRISHDGKTLVVEDDGPGVSDTQLKQILKRGVQLDEKIPGSGIGLAIVSDMAEVYGLTLAMQKSDLGGLAVEVSLPAV